MTVLYEDIRFKRIFFNLANAKKADSKPKSATPKIAVTNIVDMYIQMRRLINYSVSKFSYCFVVATVL